VGAYITDVERSEEAALTAVDARAREQADAVPASVPPVAPVPEDEAPPGDTPQDMFRAGEGRWGTREVEITEVTFLGGDGAPAHVFQSGEAVTIALRLRARDAVTDFAFGVGIFNAEGICCYGTNTEVEEFVPQMLTGEGEVRLRIDALDLVGGTYKVDVAVHRRDGLPYDYHRLLHTFRIKSRTKDVGIFRPPHRWEFSAGVKLGPRL
jgi:hypothetical protein